MKYSKHVFVCINQKKKGKKCCGEEHGLELVKRLKKRVKEAGLKKEVRINKAGCLDACAYGPALVIYPEGHWYGGVQFDDVETIVKEDLQNDQKVDHLTIDFKKPAKKWLRKQEKRRKAHLEE